MTRLAASGENYPKARSVTQGSLREVDVGLKEGLKIGSTKCG